MQIALGVERERDYRNLPHAASKQFLVTSKAWKPEQKAAKLNLLLFAYK